MYVRDVRTEWPNFYPPGVSPARGVAALEYAGPLDAEEPLLAWVSNLLGSDDAAARWLPAYGIWIQRRPLNKVHRRRGFWALNDSLFATGGRIGEELAEVGGALVFGGVQEIGSVEGLVREVLKGRNGTHGLILLGAAEEPARNFLNAQLRSPQITRLDYFVRYHVPEATVLAEVEPCLVLRTWRDDALFVDILGSQGLVAQIRN